MESKFVKMLVEGRPRKGEEGKSAPKRETGKKVGRPSGKSEDKAEKGEGMRYVVLKATVKTEEGKKLSETKKLGLINTDTIDSQKKMFERELYKKHGFDADVEDIEVSLHAQGISGKGSAKASDFSRQSHDGDYSVVDQ